MKRKGLVLFLGAEAVFCIVLFLAQASLPWIFSSMIAFPFEQIGAGLRFLSLSGFVGNFFALVLYVLISLIPGAYLFFALKKRKPKGEDYLLVLLSLLLFFVLYYMVNPGLIKAPMNLGFGESMGKALLGSMIYSVLFTYIILRVLRLFFAADTGKLFTYLNILLYLLCALFVLNAFGFQFRGLLENIRALREGNKGTESGLGLSYFFLVLQYVVNALPDMLNVTVIFFAINLINELKEGKYSERAVEASGSLAKACRRALTITAISYMAFNLLQLLFFRSLRVLHGTVKIPIVSVVFMSAILLLTEILKESNALKEDNDMII
jgi:hypothetical protein